MEKHRSKLSHLIFGTNKNKKFLDNREKFRFFGGLYSEPKMIILNIITLTGLLLCIFPFLFLSKMSVITWVAWALGVVLSVVLEQLANYHYYYFSKVANDRDFDKVKRNILYNKLLRDFSKAGIVLLVLVAALLTVSKDGSLSSLW